jgi:type VI secretion system protein ImpG
MREELLHLYERELGYLRRLGAEFAERYPKLASRLRLQSTDISDPHVERLLQGFALIAARVHLRLDDDFPEVSEALLGVVAPHYLRPIPSLTVVEFQPDLAQRSLRSGLHVPRGSPLHASPVPGTLCTFRTCFDTTVWPVTVHDARWVRPEALRPGLRASDAAGALRLELRCAPGLTFAALAGLSSLRLFLHGEASSVPATLYELLCNSCSAIVVRDAHGDGGGVVVELPPTALRPVGFEDDERLLPYPQHALTAYGLLHEYFALPEKYLFLDLDAFDAVRGAGVASAVELVFLIRPFQLPDRHRALTADVSPATVRVGCTPAVNLFSRPSEPVPLTQRRDAYPLVADQSRRRTTEVYSIDRVDVVTLGNPEPERVAPLYALRHSPRDVSPRVFWHARRSPLRAHVEDAASGPAPGSAGRDDERRDERRDPRRDGAQWFVDDRELLISFVDHAGRFTHPGRDVATARVSCHNGSLPSRLPRGGASGDFQLQSGGPLERITALVAPTDVVRPPVGRPQLARLVSQLSLNHLSLTDGGGATLRELLRLQLFDEAAPVARHVEGIVGVASEACHTRVRTADYGAVLARGRWVSVELDEDRFVGGGAYVFASVLERFFALYAGINSFTALEARTRQRPGPMRAWPPRAGCRVLT